LLVTFCSIVNIIRSTRKQKNGLPRTCQMICVTCILVVSR